MRVMWKAISPIDRVFDDVMGTMLGTATSPSPFEPAIDVTANDDQVVLSCDVPGLRKDDLEVTVENHVLTIKGARRFESRDDEQVMLGRAYGSFSRCFMLPEHVDDDQLAADLVDGVLTIRLPTHPKAKPRKIPIGNGNHAIESLEE